MTKKDSDMFEVEVTPPDPEQPMGILEDAETQDVLSADASACASPVYGRKLLPPKSQGPVSDEEPTETCTSTATAALANVPRDNRSSGLITSERPVTLVHGLG